MELKEYLEEYRALTLDLMDEVQKEANLKTLIRERDDILKTISGFEYDKKQIEVIANSLKLVELENELKNMCIKEKVKVKKKIENIKNARKVNINYNNIENKSRVFNKII